MNTKSKLAPTMASPADLHYFFETAGVLNFSRSAERLGITQPSLSLAIQRLEYSLGESVFIRHKHGVTLTPAGKQLLTHTRALLQSWEQIRAKSISSMQQIQGKFTIGCHVSVAHCTLDSFLPEIVANPNIEIQLVHDLSRKITERVVSSEIDIGIVVNPFKHPDLILQKLYDDEVAFWQVAAPASKKGESAEKKVIICDPAILQSQILMKKATAAGIQMDRVLHSSNLEVVANLTSAGCGIGILPTRVAQRAPKKLVRLPKAPTYKDEIHVITRVENKKIAGIQYICDKIKKSLSAK